MLVFDLFLTVFLNCFDLTETAINESHFLAGAEEHEEEETVINEDEVFRLPTASDYADVLTVDRKISSTSTCSTASFQSNVSTYE